MVSALNAAQIISALNATQSIDLNKSIPVESSGYVNNNPMVIRFEDYTGFKTKKNSTKVVA